MVDIDNKITLEHIYSKRLEVLRNSKAITPTIT